MIENSVEVKVNDKYPVIGQTSEIQALFKEK
jgi:hypothetical protein